MAITKFVWAEFDRAVQEELFDIKFIDFGEGRVTVYLQNTETCKNAYKSFLHCWKCQAFSFILSSNGKETSKKCLFVVGLYLTLM